MASAPSVKVSGRASLNTQVLFDTLELKILASKWTCLLGPSGVGKTTILRFIAGLETTAVFEGEIEANDALPLAGRISYMAQSDLLLPWATVSENVSLGSFLRGDRTKKDTVFDVIERVGLADHCHKLPSALSGGQRQRTALARTLMENRPIVLLDEPFSALDAKTRSEMQELTVELLKDQTVLLVTHDPSEAARLGHAIHILSLSGLQQTENLSLPLPRAVDDHELLELQGNLLSKLRLSC
tara:strand:+ start:1067 stop:1792 length:726 start_codon:yes stop_codon:yes gene_type:complete